MNRTRSLLSRLGLGRATRLAFAAAALVVATPAAATLETTTTTATETVFIGEGCWKTQVVPDAAAVAAGRLEFTEYSTVDSTRVVMQEMSRLGFKIVSLTSTPGVLSTSYSLTIKSKDNGTVVITGTATLTTNNGTAVWTTADGKVYKYNYTGVPYTPVEAES